MSIPLGDRIAEQLSEAILITRGDFFSLVLAEPTAINSNGTRYSTADHLGSPRVLTTSSAAVVSRHDYMPFGEELGSGVGGRTIGMGYGVADGLRQKHDQPAAF